MKWLVSDISEHLWTFSITLKSGTKLCKITTINQFLLYCFVCFSDGYSLLGSHFMLFLSLWVIVITTKSSHLNYIIVTVAVTKLTLKCRIARTEFTKTITWHEQHLIFVSKMTEVQARLALSVDMLCQMSKVR